MNIILNIVPLSGYRKCYPDAHSIAIPLIIFYQLSSFILISNDFVLKLFSVTFL